MSQQKKHEVNSSVHSWWRSVLMLVNQWQSQSIIQSGSIPVEFYLYMALADQLADENHPFITFIHHHHDTSYLQLPSSLLAEPNYYYYYYMCLTPFFQDNLGKQKRHQKGKPFWILRSKRRWGGRGISCTICKSFAKYRLHPSSHLAAINMGRKFEGGSAPLSGRGERGPHLTQSRLGQGLAPYQVTSWSMQPFGRNRYGPKIGGRRSWVPI